MKFIIKEVTGEQLPSLRELAAESRLVRAGSLPKIEHSTTIWNRWTDHDTALTLVACIEGADSARVVAAAQICLDTTYFRAGVAHLHGVATLPEHEGNGLATAIVCRLFHHAAFCWHATCVEWVCELLPERTHARRWFRRALDANLVDGTNCMYRISFPWTPPERIAAHYVDLRSHTNVILARSRD